MNWIKRQFGRTREQINSAAQAGIRRQAADPSPGPPAVVTNDHERSFSATSALGSAQTGCHAPTGPNRLPRSLI
jgi:hypothetical protein